MIEYEILSIKKFKTDDIIAFFDVDVAIIHEKSDWPWRRSGW